MSNPLRIHAKVHGFRQTLPDGARRLAGGWDEERYGGTTEYLRGDVADEMLVALRYVETRCVSEAAYPHASIEDRKMRDMVVAAISKAEGN
jgi:hypothetical protein